MGVIKKRVDDWLYNSKGEEVEGAEKVTVSVPGLAVGGTRAKKHELDMTARGKKAHDKERERLEEKTRELWRPYLRNIGFDVEKHTSQANDGSPEPAPQEQQSSSAPDPEINAPTAPDAAPQQP